MRGASSTPATHSSTLCEAGCVQPVVCSQPRLPRCVLRTLRVSEVRSRLYRRLRIFRNLHLVDWRASVGSAFTFAVRVFAPGFSFGGCSPAGFRFVCPFRLAVVVRLGWFGACVRSFSWRVFAVGWLLGFCVRCGWLFLVFLFVFFCWYDMLPHFLGCSALLAPALWLSLRWGLRVFAPPVLCVLPAWSLVGSACCCRRRGSFRRFLCFPALALAGLSFWLVLSCIDVRGPGSGMRDAWGAGRSPTRRVFVW